MVSNFTEYLFYSLVSNEYVYILPTPITSDSLTITWSNTWPSWSVFSLKVKVRIENCFSAIGCIFAGIWPINFVTQCTLKLQKSELLCSPTDAPQFPCNLNPLQYITCTYVNHIKIYFNYCNFKYLGFVGPLVEIFVKQHSYKTI